MSKLVDATITCPHCGKEYPTKLFRTIWGEHDSNRNMVLNDKINVPKCPHCGFSFKAPYPFMYVDVHTGFAVWWEPQYDAGIDADAQGYAQMFGASSYYATAPRIADWDEFKQVIREYYQGKRVGGKIEKMDVGALKRSMETQKKSGCLGSFVIITLASIAALGGTCYGLYHLLI
ncbi:MAG: hypothetical protein IKM74_01715 [Bacteroidales bacterium]|nr:hypothetical protein [Bacteroidales bacterium]